MIQSFVTFYSEERPHWLMWWLKTVVSLFQFLQDIYVFCRPGGPYWEKLCPWSWARPSACDLGLYSRPRAQFIPIRTSRPVNNIYVFAHVGLKNSKSQVTYILVDGCKIRFGLKCSDSRIFVWMTNRCRQGYQGVASTYIHKTNR